MTMGEGPQKSSPAGRPRQDYWSLYRQLEKTIREIEESSQTGAALSVFLESLVNQYHDSLGIEGGRIYRRESGDYVLDTMVGRCRQNDAGAGPGYRIPASYPVIRDLRDRHILISDHSNPDFDPAIEGPLHVDTFAAITVGPEDAWIISFTLAPDADRQSVLFALNTVRHVINGKLRIIGSETDIAQVRAIQSNLFPRKVPEFEGYDIYGRSQPTETVGGDVFSFIRLSHSALGILVADSSGHGLPAALQARDVVTGMRMGLADEFKMVRTVEKLNRVFHETSLSSKFVSLFYGEVERNGNFIYCNAGHVPTLHLHAGEFTLLRKGGPVLGPSADVRYARGYVLMNRDDLLVFYTDGITEANDPQENEFGLERLKQVIVDHQQEPARKIVEAVFAAVNTFAPDDPLRDDRTVVVAKRLTDPDVT
jgi:sigma-B regulation protein RsbU (phosphoserine phosphatase)